MAKKYETYEARIDGLVIERRTEFAPDLLRLLSVDERDRLADDLHADPARAATVRYERAHTGFTRVITATAADVERLAGA